jgi:mannose-6-phosphate isomerase-like protein (cupin superfamily)
VKIITFDHYNAITNQNPATIYREDVVGSSEKAKILRSTFAIMPPHQKVPYHYHVNRETFILFISGTATVTIEGKEHTIKANEMIYIPAGEKHGTANHTDSELRYLEFFTGVEGVDDRVNA